MTVPVHTVFGGTGFLGRRIVRHLMQRGARVRVAARHPERVKALFSDCPILPESVAADIHDPVSVEAAIKGAAAVANAVSLYVEDEHTTFRRVHVEGAGLLAHRARARGIDRLVHISGIGAESASDSAYVRSRGEGEEAVRAALPSATILRPAVMFGPDDAFLTRITSIVRRAPVIPLFGSGSTQLEPAYVEDVAEAAARLMTQTKKPLPLYELAGPERYRYRELVQAVARRLGRHPYLMPMPMEVWRAAGWAGEHLPGTPLTRDQIELMRKDNVASPGLPGFGALKIEPHTIDTVLGIEAKAA